MYNTEYAKYASDPWQLANNEVAEGMLRKGGAMFRAITDDKWFVKDTSGLGVEFFLCTDEQLRAGYGEHVKSLMALAGAGSWGVKNLLGGSTSGDLLKGGSEVPPAPLMTVRELLKRLSELPLDCEIELVTTGIKQGKEIYQSLEVTQTLLEDCNKGEHRRACMVFKASSAKPLSNLKEDYPEVGEEGEEVEGEEESQQSNLAELLKFYDDYRNNTITLEGTDPQYNYNDIKLEPDTTGHWYTFSDQTTYAQYRKFKEGLIK